MDERNRVIAEEKFWTAPEDVCGFSEAMANALPWLQERVDGLTPGDHGQGIRQLRARWWKMI